MAQDDTRELIIQTASKQFLLQGCKKVTMDNIATMMHISKRTIYEQFENKEELLLACMNSHNDRTEQILKKCLSREEEPLIATMLIIKISGDFLVSHAHLMEEIKDSYPDVYQRFTKDRPKEDENHVLVQLKKAQERGSIRPNANIEIASHMLINICKIMREEHHLSIKERSWILSETTFTYLRGLMTTEAIELYNSKEHEIKKSLARL